MQYNGSRMLPFLSSVLVVLFSVTNCLRHRMFWLCHALLCCIPLTACMLGGKEWCPACQFSAEWLVWPSSWC